MQDILSHCTWYYLLYYGNITSVLSWNISRMRLRSLMMRWNDIWHSILMDLDRNCKITVMIREGTGIVPG